MRLVACDLDGTLLRRDGTVSDRTRDAWLTAAAAGIEMVVVTARPARFFDYLGSTLSSFVTGLAICANGAVVYDLATRETVDLRPLSPEVAAAVVAALPGVGFAVETGSQVVYEPGFTKLFEGDIGLAAVDLAEMWWHGTPIVKLLAWSESSTPDEFLAVVRSVAGPSVECTISGSHALIEISAAGVSKAAALALLCSSIHITPGEVVAFGDMPNDLAMLQWAGRGYAVANAHPSVLASGVPVTASNEEDGVALVLETLVR